MNNYVVYMHNNKHNNKKYIGITKQDPIKRWQNGNGYKGQYYFYNAILEYGWDGFEHVILKENISQLEAVELEKYYISLFNTTNPDSGYNISSGGDCGFDGTESISYLLNNGRVDIKIKKLQARYNSKNKKRYVVYGDIKPKSAQPIIYCYECNLYFRNVNVASKATSISITSIYRSYSNKVAVYGYHFFITKGRYNTLTDEAKADIQYQVDLFLKKQSLEKA